MESESSQNQKKETTQETFRKLREKDKVEMHEKMQKIEDAQDRAKAAIAKKNRKRAKDTENERPLPNVPDAKINLKEVENLDVSPDTEPIPRPPISTTDIHDRRSITTKQERRRKRRGKCANCCGGLPGEGPPSINDGCEGHCCCSPEIRMRGGSDTDRSMNENPSRSFRVRSLSENARLVRKPQNHCCSHSSRMSILEDRQETTSNSVHDCQLNNLPIQEERIRGGCGGCGVRRSSPSNHPTSPHPKCYVQMEFPCDQTSQPGGQKNAQGSAGCPCGGCGGPACSDNPGGGGSSGGCCGGNRPRGKPCKCKCQSCDASRPLGGCGGQSCGRMYSCAGSSGGRCCFPRNTKRRSGPDCCGGGDPNCGGCC